MRPLPANAVRSRPGFTIIELIGVLVLVAIAAISAAPVLDTVERLRRVGMRDEIERRLIMARAHAMTTGMPSGVRFDMGAQAADAVQIAYAGGAPAGMSMAAGEQPLGGMFAGVEMIDVSIDPGGAHDTIWFSNDGVPHCRSANGVFIGELTQDAVVTVTGGGTVRVSMGSGLIE